MGVRSRFAFNPLRTPALVRVDTAHAAPSLLRNHSGVPVEGAKTTPHPHTLQDPPARAIRNELLTHHITFPLSPLVLDSRIGNPVR